MKLILTLGKQDRVADIENVVIFRATEKCVTVRLSDGTEWLLKDKARTLSKGHGASLIKMEALAKSASVEFVRVHRNALVNKKFITGKIRGFQVKHGVGCVISGGDTVKVGQRKAGEFNRIFAGMVAA